jgi:RecB family exonuclease
MGVNRDFKPVAYKEAWLRGIIDTLVLVPDATTAIITDFKTGKRWLDWQQHDIGALLVFSHHPRVTKINASFQWLAEENPAKQVDRKVYLREELPSLRAELLPLVERIEWSAGSGVYPKREGPLCAWCPVTDCQFWKPRP